MFLRGIEPFDRIANIFTLDYNAKKDIFNNLKTSDCRLFYIISGGGSFVAENIIYQLSEGCVILFQSGTEYCWQPDKKGIKYVAVNFDYTQNFKNIKKSFHPNHSSAFKKSSILEEIIFNDAIALNKPLFFENMSKYESQLRLLSTEFYIGRDYCEELLSSVMKTIIISLVRESVSVKLNNKNSYLEITRNTVEFIQSNYHKDINNQIIADNFNFHPTYLNRIFKKNIGISMHAFLRDYRLNVAMDMLRISDMGIAQIAEKAGFIDVPHFSVSFKKYTGVSPSKFREER